MKKRTAQPKAQLHAQQLALAFDAATPSLSAPRKNQSDGASPSANAARLRQIVLAGDAYTFRLRRAKRRTIGFQIDDAGLMVSAPRWVTLREIEAALVEKQRWIRAKLVEWREWRARRRLPTVEFADGGTLPYLGGVLTLRLGREPQTTRLLESLSEPPARELHLALPAAADEQQVRDAVQAWLQGEARRVLGQRLALLSQGLDVKPRAWTISSARSQWGSCTHDGRIRLSWRLIHFALPVIDYVVAHELAHLKELNHSPRFWSAVAQLLPGFEAARDEIRQQDVAALPL